MYGNSLEQSENSSDHSFARFTILKKILKGWIIYCCFIGHVYNAYNAFAMLYTKNELWSTLTYAWFTHSTSVAFDVILIKKTKIRQVLNNIETYYSNLTSTGKKAVTVFWTRLWVIMIPIAILAFLFNLSWVHTRTGFDLYKYIWMKFMCLKCDNSKMTAAEIKGIAFFENMHCSLTIELPWIILPLLYFSLTRVIQEVITEFNNKMKSLEKCASSITVTEIECLMLKHKKIRTTLELFNDIFSGVVFLWFGTAAMATYQGAVHLSNAAELDIFIIFLFMKVDFLPLFVIIGLTFLATGVAEKANESLIFAQNLSYQMQPDSVDAMIMLMNQLNMPLLGVTAGYCFVLTRELCLSFIATAVTFVFVFVQMNPTVYKN